MVMRDIRYMWSEIDSPLLYLLAHPFIECRVAYCSIPNLLHPSRFEVLRRSRTWKKGTGESELVFGAPPGIFATAASTVHGSFAPEMLRYANSDAIVCYQ